MTDTTALLLIGLGAAGASGGVWLSLGATVGRPLAWRAAWAVVAAVIGASFAFGLPAACVDQARFGAPEAAPSGRYGT